MTAYEPAAITIEEAAWGDVCSSTEYNITTSDAWQ